MRYSTIQFYSTCKFRHVTTRDALFDHMFRKPPPEHFGIVIATLPVDFGVITNDNEGGCTDDGCGQNHALWHGAPHINPGKRKRRSIRRFVIDSANIPFPRLTERTVVRCHHDQSCAGGRQMRNEGQHQRDAEGNGPGGASEHGQTRLPAAFGPVRRPRPVRPGAPDWRC